MAREGHHLVGKCRSILPESAADVFNFSVNRRNEIEQAERLKPNALMPASCPLGCPDLGYKKHPHILKPVAQLASH